MHMRKFKLKSRVKKDKEGKRAHGQYIHTVHRHKYRDMAHTQIREHRLETSVVRHHSDKTKNPQVK